MVRCLPVLLTTALTWAVAPAAPRPKEKAGSTPYYATRLGDRLVYDDRGRDRTWEVTGVEEKEGETIVSVSEVVDTAKHPMEKVVVSAQGLRKIELGQFKIEPWLCFKNSARPGDSWDVQMDSQQNLQGHAGKMTVGKEVEVETPAGKFRAVPVVGELTPLDRMNNPAGPAEKYTWWFAPGVGVVKMVWPDGKARVLKAFIPGGAPGKKD